MVGAICQDYGAAPAVSRVGESRHNTSRRNAMKRRPARKRLDPCMARRDTRSLRWQAVVGGGSANDDPVGIVARLSGDLEQAAKARACLQRDSVAAGGGIECLLKVFSLLYEQGPSGCGSVSERAANISPGQFGGTVELGRGGSCALRQGSGTRMVQHRDAEPSQNERDSDRRAG